MLTRVLDANPAWTAPPHLRAILVGGATAPPKLLRRAAAHRVPIVVTYGLTETCSQVTATPYAARFAPEEWAAGAPLAGIELRISDGRIEVKGPVLMAGYWDEPPLAPDTWFDTGDLGTIDAAGRLHVHARRVDLIVTGGENAYPAEVERTLEAFPGIAAAGVFGVPDEVWGQTVAAALVAEEEPPPDSALIEYISSRLAPHKRPRHVCYVSRLPHAPYRQAGSQGAGQSGTGLRPLFPATRNADRFALATANGEPSATVPPCAPKVAIPDERAFASIACATQQNWEGIVRRRPSGPSPATGGRRWPIPKRPKSLISSRNHRCTISHSSIGIFVVQFLLENIDRPRRSNDVRASVGWETPSTAMMRCNNLR